MTTAVAPEKKEKETAAPQTTAVSRGVSPDVELPSLNRLRQEFDDLWNRFYQQMPALWNAERNDVRWAFKVADEPEAYVVTAEAPGFSPEDFQVELRGDQLVLQARKANKEKSKDKESLTSTEFYRAMTIPAYVAADGIEASYDKEILTVRLPKTEDGKGRRIPVKG